MFAVGLLVFSVIITSCSLKQKTTEIGTGTHPVTSFREISVLQEDDGIQDELNSYFGDDCKPQCCFSKGDDEAFLIYYSGSKILVECLGLDGEPAGEICLDSDKTLCPGNIARVNDSELLLLASDSDCNNYIVKIENDSISEYVNLGSDSGILYDVLYEDGSVYLVYQDKVCKCDDNCNVVSTYESKNEICGAEAVTGGIIIGESGTAGVAADGDSASGTSFEIVELNTSNLTKKTNMNFTESIYGKSSLYSGYGELSFATNGENGLLVSCSSGIYQVDIGKKDAKMLVNTADYGLSRAAVIYGYDGISINSLSTYYDVTRKEDIDVIADYVCSSDSSSEKINLTAGCFGGSDYTAYFEMFNRINDDCYISIEEYIGESGELNSDDIISVMNDNSGLDIMVFGNSMLDTFVDSGYLYDLNLTDIDDDSMINNVYSLSETDGKRYYVMPSFSVRIFAYNNKIVNGSEMTVENALNQCDYPELIGNQTLQSLTMAYYGIIDADIRDDNKISEDTVRTYISLCDLFGKDYQENDPMAIEIKNGTHMFNILEISSVEQFYTYCCYYPDCFSYTAPWGYDGPAVISDDYIGINANSDNKEKAADFINFMLSRDIQNTLAGIPINGDSLNDRINNFIMETDRSAAEAYIQEYALRSDGELDNIESEIGSQVTSSQSGNGDELSDMDNNLPEGIEIILDSDKLEAIAQTYREIVFEANEYDSNDRQIINMLIEEAEGYLNGSVDGESTVDVISSKVNLYLSELEPYE